MREMDTGDSDRDIAITPGVDHLIIPLDKAKLWINKTNYGTALT